MFEFDVEDLANPEHRGSLPGFGDVIHLEHRHVAGVTAALSINSWPVAVPSRRGDQFR